MRTLVALIAAAVTTTAAAIDPIPRRLPPEGKPLEPSVADALTKRLIPLRERADSLVSDPLAPDAEIYLKALDLALDHHEFYDHKKDLPKAEAALAEAEKRLTALRAGKSPWTSARGSVVRGYRSSVDGSAQPYGLNIPEQLDLTGEPVPLYVWLHGRGDKNTDLHFIHDRSAKNWQFAGHLDDGVVLHPFGRQCIGYKSAGEVDVLEAVDHVIANYNVDPNRVALMGFSMGGAGAWHLGAHYPDRWAVVHAGAGFVDVKRYQKLSGDKLPGAVEQKLWGVYDVPHYARNLLNLPVVAYSGENDKQKDAADYMEETLARHGRTLPHHVGPGMGHKYHPETIKDVAAFVRDALTKPKTQSPSTVTLQTRTLRYNRVAWVEATTLGQHWQDARIDATAQGNRLELTTANVLALKLHRRVGKAHTVVIDGTPVPSTTAYHRTSPTGRWRMTTPDHPAPQGRKSHGLQGPIDDAFLAPFLVVAPTAKSSHPAVDEWVAFELDHLKARWRALFRADLPVKPDHAVTRDDALTKHLVLFGTPESNRLIRKAIDGSPLTWSATSVALGSTNVPAGSHVPLMVYPNPAAPGRYIVLNSGPTFREAHDRTNSLQNPKLGDYAIIDITTPPSAETPGRVLTSGFFDERWQIAP